MWIRWSTEHNIKVVSQTFGNSAEFRPCLKLRALPGLNFIKHLDISSTASDVLSFLSNSVVKMLLHFAFKLIYCIPDESDCLRPSSRIFLHNMYIYMPFVEKDDTILISMEVLQSWGLREIKPNQPTNFSESS